MTAIEAIIVTFCSVVIFIIGVQNAVSIPVAVIAIGVWLVAAALLDRRKP